MTKIFISQPMNGKTTEEIKSRREKAIQSIDDYYNGEYEVIDNLLESEIPSEEIDPFPMLICSLSCINDADIVYFIDDWENYRGCRIEHQCCLEYGIPTGYIKMGE